MFDNLYIWNLYSEWGSTIYLTFINLPICLIIYQSISIYYLSLSSICYLLFLLSITIDYSLSYLLLSIISYLSIIYLSLSIIWLFSLYLYDAKKSHHVPPQGRSWCPGVEASGRLESSWAEPRLSFVPEAAWGCQAWCRTALGDPGLTVLPVGFAGWVVAELQRVQLSCSVLLFLLRFIAADPTSICITHLAWRACFQKAQWTTFAGAWVSVCVYVCVHMCKCVSKHVTVCVCNRVCACVNENREANLNPQNYIFSEPAWL